MVLNKYFNDNNIAVSVPSTVAAAYALKDKLDWKSPAQVEFSEVLARLEPAQCLVVKAWFEKQRRLKTEGDEGFSNLNQIVSWLLNRRYGVTEAGSDMALTNVQNNSSRKLFWHEGAKQDRTIWNGKLNHALLQNTEPSKRSGTVQGFHPNGRRNHAFKANTDEPSNPTPALDSWKEIVDRYRAQWITPGQRDKLEAEYNAGIATGKS